MNAKSLPDLSHLSERERELWLALLDAREALCAAMRVIAGIDTGSLLNETVPGIAAETAQQRFIDEVHAIGLKDGFGARIDDTLKAIGECGVT